MSTSQSDQAMQAFRQKQKKQVVRRWVSIVILLLVAGAAVWYFVFNKKDAAAITVYRFAAVEHGDIIKAITATGTIQATKTVQVGTQVSGVVRELHADFNSKVKKGELIAVIDPTFYEAAIKQSEANYQKALADLNKTKLDAERAEALFKKDLLSKADYDAAIAARATSSATAQQAEAALEQAKVNLGYTQIHAPISGTIVSRNVDVGQTVAASLNAPVLFVIAEDLEKMQVWASVDEADIGGVKAGQPVNFTVDAYGDEKFHGVVNEVRLNATITQNVVNYTVIIDADNPDLKLLPSMTATVTIINASKQNVQRIPVAALRFTPPDMERQGGGQKGQHGGGMRQGGGQGQHKPEGGGGGQAMAAAEGEDSTGTKGVVFVKSGVKPDGTPKFEPVPVMTGISDGLYVELISSARQLQQTDSLAVGSYTLTSGGAAGSSGQPGTNPFGAPGARGGATRRM
ncbi:MAG: efflux RND transporter periplasmic adaptor subunit [Bacteroidetes bacterium]|nr:efflux RND transporter periplasmic adaptor subunit [Bacteroidota bacterium]